MKRFKEKIDPVQERERKDSLYSLGFTYYSEYLKSYLWKKIRKQVLERDGGTCRFCNKKALVVHHTSYDLDTMSGKNLTYLHSCCSQCHKNGHKSKRAELPKKQSQCPQCKEYSLGREEIMVNNYPHIKDAAVCKRCRKMAMKKYLKFKKNPEQAFSGVSCSINDYFSLPQEFKYSKEA